MSHDATRIIVFDTTLRDGEQAPGLLDGRAGEAEPGPRSSTRSAWTSSRPGFPIASPADAEAVRQVAREVRRPVIAALARCRRQDIEEAARALEPAERRRIHTFLATSDLHLDAQAAHDARGVPRGDRRRRPLARAASPTTWSSRRRMRRAATSTSCAASSRRSSRRRDDDQPARHGRLRDAGRDPRLLRRHHRAACRTPTRRSSARTATTTSGWPSPTAWRPFRAACGRSSARSTASASAPATRRSKRS